MKIPVFHDDQHGAAVVNGLRVVGKSLDTVKLVSTGDGAAGIAGHHVRTDTKRLPWEAFLIPAPV